MSRQRNYYLAHREQVLSAHRAWRKKNPTYSRRYYLANREKQLKQIRSAYLKRRHGLTDQQYEAWFEEQDGVCAICRQPSDCRLAVDHDHVTGLIRGLLCFACNASIGQFGDSPERLRQAAEYLERALNWIEDQKEREWQTTQTK